MILADFEREYRIGRDVVPAMGRLEFIARIGGLSAESRWMHAVREDKGPPASVGESIAILDGI